MIDKLNFLCYNNKAVTRMTAILGSIFSIFFEKVSHNFHKYITQFSYSGFIIQLQKKKHGKQKGWFLWHRIEIHSLRMS